eukprot:NODE_1661_length_880_cov_73.738869_g1302_i0.p1 GENE.NODE_1661_length_880_cov_73.738869_g1302_i0~~NODE_1661_length_880_cov_73.738869_g1302_i0.p1  ORF type:complete len:194 (+),score=26.31 NODE_1661_length_880_cov_73.738869_g1302_i0:69-650(+)
MSENNQTELSVLLSLGSVSDALSTTDLCEKVSSGLGVQPEDLELFKLSPLSSSSGPQVAVRVKSDKMTVDYFKFLLAERKRLQVKVEKSGEALATLQQACRKSSELRVAPQRTTQMSPRDSRLPTQKRLEMNNRFLAAEVDDLRQKLIKSERFKKEVLHTVKDLKRQLAVLTEEILLNDWEMEDENDSEAEND